MSRRKMKMHANDDGMKVAIIDARDLEAGDRIMNTRTNQFTKTVKSVEKREGNRLHVVWVDGQEADYAIKKGDTWIIDASGAS